ELPYKHLTPVPQGKQPLPPWRDKRRADSPSTEMKNRMFRTTGQGTRSGSLGGDTSRPKAKSISLFMAVLGNQNLLDLKGLCLWKTVPQDKSLDYVWRTLDSLFNFTEFTLST
ncbi:hypothetical protein GOODEAATRI_022190, partial [Goodea atripinnis]